MKNIYKFLIVLLMYSFVAADLLHAQQEVLVRDLHTYDTTPESQADLPGHPLNGVEVTFDAVIVSYPKNSGLASITDAGVPGRIHVFVTDVNAIEEGEEGMSIQIVVDGAQRETLEGLTRGEVIKVTGELSFFGNISQFNASDVEFLGSIQDAEFEDLAPLLEPTVINLSDINQAADGAHQWVAENYTTYINRYVKLEGLAVLDRTIEDQGRPGFVLTDGNTVVINRDVSLRFRNDRGTYAFDPGTGEGLNYNYRRLADELDGPFAPPPPGSVVDISGYLVVDTFDAFNQDISSAQSTIRISPMDDGVVWQNDGDDPDDRLTPEGWPNDFVVLGFAPILENFTQTPEDGITSTDEVAVSIDVLLPEDDYTIESVEIHYSAFPYTEDSGTTVVEAMTADGGDTYSFTFDTQSDFTNVEYEIVATVKTPEEVATTARDSGSFFVESETQASPPVFTPAAGTFTNQVSVNLSSSTDGATIFYTLDGSDPDETSAEFTSDISLTQTATIHAIAVADGLDDSPINQRTYEIEEDAVEVSTLADLRASAQDDTFYKFIGEAVVTYARGSDNRNQRYLMDDSGGILIDDPDGNITSQYGIGDVITNVTGTLSSFREVVQFHPAFDPGASESTAEVEPVKVSLSDLDYALHESMLIEVEDLRFTTTGTFESSTNYDVTDPSLEEGETALFRTNFSEADYIGEEIPEGAVNLTAIVGGFDGTPQLIARSLGDFEAATSTDLGTNPFEFELAQNYPNPFNPSTRINYSLAESAEVQLIVYDILGRRVASLVNGLQTAGTYTVNFDMSQFASGTYIYRLEAGDFVSVRKMMLIK